MLEFAELPQKASSGADPATVAAIVEALRENPARTDVRFSDDSFSPQAGDKKPSEDARGRASSAGHRMRESVADAIGIDKGALSGPVRKVNDDPIRYAYWITAKDAAGLEVLRHALATDISGTDDDTEPGDTA